MIEVLTCPNCGAQFESNGPGTRCPVCGSRAEPRQMEREQRRGSAEGSSGAFFFSSSRGGVRAVSWGGGRGLVLALVSLVLFPFLTASGLVAIAIGAIFDVETLLTLGFVLMTLGAVAFAVFLLKLWRGFRSARRLMRDLGGEAADLRDVEGMWRTRP